MTTDTATPAAKTPEPAKKRAGVGKWLVRILATLVILILIACALYYFLIDGIIRSKVVDAAKLSTKQEAALEAATLRTFAGNLTLSKLNINNPSGYQLKQLLDLGTCSIDVKAGSLLTNKIEVPEIILDGLTVNIEQAGLSNNLVDIIKTITEQKSDPNASSGKELDIGKITFKNVKINVKFPIPGFESKTFALKDFTLEKPFDPASRPKMIDVFLKILVQIAQQVATDGQFKGIQDMLNQHLGDLTKKLKIPGLDMKGLDDLQKNFKLPFNKK